MIQYTVKTPQKLNADIDLPASKSISNRALIIHALSGGKIIPQNLSDCDDTEVIINALNNMPDVIDIKAAGTAMRFMTAYLSVTPGEHTLTGTERMKHRPIGVLVNALRQLGADITYLGEEGISPTPHQRKPVIRRTYRDTGEHQFSIHFCPFDDRAYPYQRAGTQDDGQHHFTSLHRPDTLDDARIRCKCRLDGG